MALDQHERLALHQGLVNGLDPETADRLMAALPPVDWAAVATKQDLLAFEERLDHRFDSIDHRLGSMDHRFDSIDHRLASNDHRFDSIDHRFDSIDHRFDSIDHRFDSIDHRFDSIDHRFDRVDEQFEVVHEKFNVVHERFTVIDERLATFEPMIEGKIATHMRGLFFALAGLYLANTALLAGAVGVAVSLAG